MTERMVKKLTETGLVLTVVGAVTYCGACVVDTVASIKRSKKQNKLMEAKLANEEKRGAILDKLDADPKDLDTMDKLLADATMELNDRTSELKESKLEKASLAKEVKEK